MKKFNVCVLLSFLLVGNLQAESEDSIIKPLEEFINNYMEKLNIPGLAIAVFDGEKEYVRLYGVANRERNSSLTPQTIFEIASITKVVTSTDLALHIEEGKIALNDLITFYLPKTDKNFGAINQVTLLELATHTSSLPRIPPPLFDKQRYTRQNVIDFLQRWEPENPIGTHYLYSNLGFGLIGYALENFEHKTYEEVIKDDILAPLEMWSTMIEVPYDLMANYAQGYARDDLPIRQLPISVWPASGALRSTIEDMLKFLKANLSIAGPEKLLYAMQIAHRGYFTVNEKLTMGLGWQRVHIKDRLIIDKNGGSSGFSSYIGMIPEKKIGIVFLTNKAKINSTYFGRLLLLILDSQT